MEAWQPVSMVMSPAAGVRPPPWCHLVQSGGGTRRNPGDLNTRTLRLWAQKAPEIKVLKKFEVAESRESKRTAYFGEDPLA
ncbi:hypothetical protein MHYP_G00142920 [Metynnis hypsauchen]